MEEYRELDPDTWLSLQEKHTERVRKESQDAQRSRRQMELVLVVTCAFAAIYSYGTSDFTKNPEIEIPAISLKLPLKDAIAIFPTLVATVYVVFITSVAKQLVIETHLHLHSIRLSYFKEHGLPPASHQQIDAYEFLGRGSLRKFLLPSPLHQEVIPGSPVGSVARGLSQVAVGVVFVLAPYATAAYAAIKSHTLLGSSWVLVWNIFWLAVMFLVLVSAAAGAELASMRKEARNVL